MMGGGGEASARSKRRRLRAERSESATAIALLREENARLRRELEREREQREQGETELEESRAENERLRGERGQGENSAVPSASGAAATGPVPRWDELPDQLWTEVLKRLPDSFLFAFASTCKQFRRVQVASGREMVTDKWEVLPRNYDSKVSKVSQGWCLWHSGTLRTSDEKEAELILWAAAYHGYLEVLKLWRERSKSKRLWTSKVCDWAAIGGQLDSLKFLRSQDTPCPFSHRTCYLVAKCGHLEVLRWLRSEGCPWDKDNCRKEANGCTHVRRWIDEQSD